MLTAIVVFSVATVATGPVAAAADPSISVSNTPDTVSQNDTVSITYEIENAGADIGGFTTTVTQLPSGATVDAITGAIQSSAPDDNPPTASTEAIAPGETGTITVSYRLNDNVSTGDAVFGIEVSQPLDNTSDTASSTVTVTEASPAGDETSTPTASDITVGQSTAIQTVTWELDIDDTEHTITVSPSDAESITVADVAAPSATVDGDLTIETAISGSGPFNVGVSGDPDTGEVDGTLRVNYTVDTTGVPTSTGETGTISGETVGSATPSFNLTAADSIAVTTTNDNTIGYAVGNLAQDGTVSVAEGNYSEDVRLGVDGLTLVGAGEESTTITGQGSQPGTVRIPSTHPGITVSGLTIEAGSNANAVHASPEGNIPDLTFSENTLVAGRDDVTAFIGGDHGTVDFDRNTFTSREGSVSKHLVLAGQASHGSEAASATSDGSADAVTDNAFEAYTTTAIEFEAQHGEITGNEFTSSTADSTAIAIPGAVGDGNSVAIEGGSILLSQNNFDAETTGVDVASSVNGSVNATSNWWGDVSGPSGQGSGSGASVSENVVFEPWLDAKAPGGQAVERQGLKVTLEETALGVTERTAVASVEEVLSTGVTRRDLTEQVTLESADSSVASVNGTTIIAESPGATTITATADGLDGAVDIRVGLINDIEISLEDDRIPVDGATGFTVNGTFTDGSVSEVTTNADIELTAGEPRATIDTASNMLTGDTQGSVTIEATLQGETDTAELDVFRTETKPVENNRVEFDDVNSTRSIEFDEDVPDTSEVTVTESTRPPEDAPEPPPGVDPVVSPDYEVPDEAVDTPATIELDVSGERLNEVGLEQDELEARLTALREQPGGDGYETVSIVDIDTNDNGATVTIETPGFSTFILGGTSPSTGGSGGGGSGGVTGGGVTGVGGGASSTSGQAKTVSDVRPGTPGTTVTFDQTGLSAITFNSETVEGTAAVDRLDGVPGNAPPFSPNRPVAAVFAIDVPDEQTDSPATLKFDLRADDFADVGLDPDEATVLRDLDDEYEQLDPDVEVNGDTVTVTAETPGFSTFIITDAQTANADASTDTPVPDDGATPASNGGTSASNGDATEMPEPDPDPEADPEPLPGFGVVVALVALLAAALLAVRRHA